MKNRFCYWIMVMLTFAALIPVFGQVGVKAGMGISDIGFRRFGQSPYLGYENNGVIHNLPKISYEVGIYIPWSLSQKWAIQPELKYMAMGINYNTHFLYEDITYKLHINYLQLPVLIKYNIIRRERSRTALYIGPYAALNMGVVRHLKVEGIKATNKVHNVKNEDIGVIIGFSLERNFSAGVANIDLRIGYSLINMMDPVEGHFAEYNKTPEAYARNINVTFSVGYLFEDIFNKRNKS